jgi:hypothetical protein
MVALVLMSFGWVVAVVSSFVDLPRVRWSGWGLVLVGCVFLSWEWRRVWRRQAPYDRP